MAARASLGLMAIALPLVAGASGHPSCPCLRVSKDHGIVESNGSVVWSEGDYLYGQHNYGRHYGLLCSGHDDFKPPSCDNATSKPGWCLDAWCYVDPDVCSLKATFSTYRPGVRLAYSYQTCGMSGTPLPSTPQPTDRSSPLTHRRPPRAAPPVARARDLLVRPNGACAALFASRSPCSSAGHRSAAHADGQPELWAPGSDRGGARAADPRRGIRRQPAHALPA